jgi:hypothetical protein
MLSEFSAKREEFTCISGAASPIDDGPVLVEFCFSPEPFCPRSSEMVTTFKRSHGM